MAKRNQTRPKEKATTGLESHFSAPLKLQQAFSSLRMWQQAAKTDRESHGSERWAERQTGWYRKAGVEIYSTEERPEIDSSVGG